jgi:hypothetical protein
MYQLCGLLFPLTARHSIRTMDDALRICERCLKIFSA